MRGADFASLTAFAAVVESSEKVVRFVADGGNDRFVAGGGIQHHKGVVIYRGVYGKYQKNRYTKCG